MQRNLANDEGNSVLETALVLPLLVLLLTVAIDLGLAFRAAIVTSSAAQAGALYGVQHPTDTAGMVSAAQLDASNWSALVPVATYGCECSDGSGASAGCATEPACSYNSVLYVELDTTGTYTPMLPYPGLPGTLTLHGKARMRASR